MKSLCFCLIVIDIMSFFRLELFRQTFNNCELLCNFIVTQLTLNKLNAERIIKTRPFVNKHNWKGINYPSEKDDWKKFGRNNVKIALNVSYAKKEKIYPSYVSKHNSIHKKQVILLMISNGEKLRQARSSGRWYYLVVKKLQHY